MNDVFDPNLFVGRSELVDLILKWADRQTPNGSNLWSIVGPAGIGKSWLLAHIRHQLQQKTSSDDLGRSRLVFWLDLSSDFARDRDHNSGRSAPRYDLTLLEDQIRWFKTLVSQMQEQYPTLLGNLDYEAPFESLLESFIQQLCVRAQPEAAPILIVDGLDEASDEEKTILEEHILRNFLTYECTLVLLAFRDDYHLRNHHLRRVAHIQRLDILENEDRNAQLDKLVSGHEDLAAIKSGLTHYDWSHPQLNALLVERALLHEDRRLKPHDLMVALEQISEPLKIVPEIFDLLLDIVREMSPLWTLRHLRTQLALTSRDERIESMFKAGIIYNVSGTARYQIANGIRELLQDYLRLAFRSKDGAGEPASGT